MHSYYRCHIATGATSGQQAERDVTHVLVTRRVPLQHGIGAGWCRSRDGGRAARRGMQHIN